MRIICIGFLLVCVAVVISGQPPDCPPCDRTACPNILEGTCPAGILFDECGCCHICSRKLNQNCGGKLWNLGRCGRAYFCLGPHPGRAINIGKGEVGFCKCRQDERVCGNNGIVYENNCALNETSFEELKYGGNKIEVSTDRRICTSAPRIRLVFPATNSSLVKPVGEQVYMQCEGDGFPTPVITWTKEDALLPSDFSNIAVQSVGGPRKNQATGWLLINPVSAQDAGEYTCEVRNGIGETLRATARLIVTDA